MATCPECLADDVQLDRDWGWCFLCVPCYCGHGCGLSPTGLGSLGIRECEERVSQPRIDRRNTARLRALREAEEAHDGRNHPNPARPSAPRAPEARGVGLAGSTDERPARDPQWRRFGIDGSLRSSDGRSQIVDAHIEDAEIVSVVEAEQAWQGRRHLRVVTEGEAS